MSNFFFTEKWGVDIHPIHPPCIRPWKRWFTPRDTLQTIDMIGGIVTGFMKKMPEYAETITNLQIVPYLNQATQKNTCQKKTPNSKISNPKKSFDQLCQLKSGVPALGRT